MANEKIAVAMTQELLKEGYKLLHFNTYYLIVEDGSGYPYIRLAKIARDSNTQSIYLQRFSLPASDIKVIRNDLKSKTKGMYIDIKV
jgi:hypothetical protein